MCGLLFSVKAGDDLRQEQLASQFFTLAHRILKQTSLGSRAGLRYGRQGRRRMRSSVAEGGVVRSFIVSVVTVVVVVVDVVNVVVGCCCRCRCRCCCCNCNCCRCRCCCRCCCCCCCGLLLLLLLLISLLLFPVAVMMMVKVLCLFRCHRQCRFSRHRWSSTLPPS